MEPQALHDLTAAYALDALTPDEVSEYEAHLARCPHCREELASLSETTTALAYGIDAPMPPPALRERILESARNERPNVAPLRPRWALPAAAVAVAAVAAVVALAVWASSLSNKVNHLQASAKNQRLVEEILASPNAQSIDAGGGGRLVVTANGDAALILTGLAPAPKGKIYEAWVLHGGAPQPAGTFDSTGGVTAVALQRPVPAGSKVMVTRERHREDAPTEAPFISIST